MLFPWTQMEDSWDIRRHFNGYCKPVFVYMCVCGHGCFYGSSMGVWLFGVFFLQKNKLLHGSTYGFEEIQTNSWNVAILQMSAKITKKAIKIMDVRSKRKNFLNLGKAL